MGEEAHLPSYIGGRCHDEKRDKSALSKAALGECRTGALRIVLTSRCGIFKSSTQPHLLAVPGFRKKYQIRIIIIDNKTSERYSTQRPQQVPPSSSTPFYKALVLRQTPSRLPGFTQRADSLRFCPSLPPNSTNAIDHPRIRVPPEPSQHPPTPLIRRLPAPQPSTPAAAALPLPAHTPSNW